MKAREFLAREIGENAFTLRNVVKERLDADELEKLAAMAGGAEALVAPKRRAEAAKLSGKKLVEWLAADGARLRRPIVVVDRKVTLGFTAESRETLKSAL